MICGKGCVKGCEHTRLHNLRGGSSTLTKPAPRVVGLKASVCNRTTQAPLVSAALDIKTCIDAGEQNNSVLPGGASWHAVCYSMTWDMQCELVITQLYTPHTNSTS